MPRLKRRRSIGNVDFWLFVRSARKGAVTKRQWWSFKLKETEMTIRMACSLDEMRNWLEAHGLGDATIRLGMDDGSEIGDDDEVCGRLVARFIHADWPYHASTAWMPAPS